jgi:hypothetical protein
MPRQDKSLEGWQTMIMWINFGEGGLLFEQEIVQSEITAQLASIESEAGAVAKA